jgi:hypothetical protein
MIWFMRPTSIFPCCVESWNGRTAIKRFRRPVWALRPSGDLSNCIESRGVTAGQRSELPESGPASRARADVLIILISPFHPYAQRG